LARLQCTSDFAFNVLCMNWFNHSLSHCFFVKIHSCATAVCEKWHILSNCLQNMIKNGGGWGRSGTLGWMSPGCFFLVLPKRSIPKPDPHGRGIIQRESLGTDMLLELMINSYTRYYIELINSSCCLVVSFLPVVDASVITLMNLPILSHRWTKRQRGWEVTVLLAILLLAELSLHPKPCPLYSLLFVLKGDVNQPSSKTITWLLIITLANVGQFSKFFHCQILEETLYMYIIKIRRLTLHMFLH